MKRNSKIRLFVSMRNICFTALLLITAGMMSSSTFAANPDFSGMWKLDEGKSEIGEGRFRPSMTLDVKQDKENLNVVRVRIGRDGEERKRESVYSLDGKETTSGQENRTTVSTANWSKDGTLTILSKRTFTRNGETFESETTEKWILGEGGKMLTIQSKFSSSRGEVNVELVYNLGS